MTALRSATKKLLGLVLFTLIASGCSSINKGSVGPWRSEPVLKKRITVVPFMDLAGLGAEATEAVTEQVVEMLANSPHLVLYPCPLEIAALADPHKRGAMVEKAAELGFNALIVGQLNPHEIDVKKKGIWPFRSVVKTVYVSLVIDVLETTTGTILLTHNQREEVEFEESGPNQSEEDLSQAAWKKVLPDILQDPVEKVIDVLEDQPWIGRIIGEVKEEIQIDGGKDLGIKPLSIFEVFRAEEFVTAKDGRRYPISWKRVGKIQIKEVRETSSVATPLKGGPFLPGQCVVLSD